jgi:hypothetical protein
MSIDILGYSAYLASLLVIYFVFYLWIVTQSAKTKMFSERMERDDMLDRLEKAWSKKK